MAEKAFSRVAEDFPELGARLKEELADAFKIEGGGGLDPTALADMVKDTIAAHVGDIDTRVDRATQRAVLSIHHSDWKQVVVADEFKAWLAGQPAEKQSEFNNSWDASVVGDYLTRFKDHKTSQAAEATSKQRRLEDAITPTRGRRQGPTLETEEAAFLAGFNGA